MHLVVTRTTSDSAPETEDLRRFAFSDPVIAEVALQGLRRSCRLNSSRDPVILLPNEWRPETPRRSSQVAWHNGSFQYRRAVPKKQLTDAWTIISNGRYITSFNRQAIQNVLNAGDYDLAALYVDPALSSNSEKIVFTSEGSVAGFCRFYADSILPARIPAVWPHHLFVKRTVFEDVFGDGSMPLDFPTFYARCTAAPVKQRCFKIGGTVQDLENPNGLRDFIAAGINSLYPGASLIHHGDGRKTRIPASTRIYGRVLIGDNVQMADNVVLVGPTILCDNVTVGRNCLIKAAVIEPGLVIANDTVIQDRILTAAGIAAHAVPQAPPYAPEPDKSETFDHWSSRCADNYRQWPLVSYPRLGKRTADILVALGVLICLAPLFPVIALAIKLTSSGPVFFGHKRQGRHGKEFYCLKFRTMIPGADNIQDKLRVKNQVDGPQFKMEDDPRVTSIGRFMRDTYIDELPQFINVLLGQMSLVGPRPSPQKENSLRPTWHDARLSVRPGITGLWQVKRTRKTGQDFQEWIHYDTEYVRRLSLKMDVSICWQTVKKIVSSFISHF